MFLPLTTDALRESLAGALAHRNDATASLSQGDFSGAYSENPDWAVGPFVADDSLAFRPTGQWADPTGIGWTSASIYNPSVIEHEGVLHLFYRASPSKESLSSRIGHAALAPGAAWADSPSNPVVYPTQPLELLGCEDPKIYRAEGRWYLFYNGIYPLTREAREAFTPDPQAEVGCEILLAVSDDLENWTKLGSVVDPAVSHLWAKGAVVPRNGAGEAVRIGGEYLMFLSEGCGGALHVGRSTDFENWTFAPEPYLDLGPLDGHLHEVACALVDDDAPDRLVLDFFYGEPDGSFAAGQALYDTAAPFTQRALHRGGALSWGGMIRSSGGDDSGARLFAQGWDAAPGERRIDFYTDRSLITQ
ncbi:hypothetical protein [Frondihabitans peucedani]|uniref:Uncharacterized protein n=1 Tax=Frondihabitans peucedani TaxID=598626 RepID=A0ABP8E241_9MICO